MSGRDICRRWWWTVLLMAGAGVGLSLASSPAAAGTQSGAGPEQISRIHLRAIVDLSALAHAPSQGATSHGYVTRPGVGPRRTGSARSARSATTHSATLGGAHA